MDLRQSLSSSTMAQSSESFTFTVGKLDAGMAILLGERAHLIEFPSILLPQGATTGSIVNIAVHRNLAEEKRRDHEFWELQKEIYSTFGVDMPEPPKLEVRNVTQTSVTLEWPPLHLATAKLRSLDIYRNGQRLAAIPQPLQNTSTKLSGLELNTDYTFQLVLRTTAGTFPSAVARVRTHTMTDTSGISVCFGTVQDKVLFEHVKVSLREMRARWSDKIQIDTTHFVCTTPATESAGANSGPGVEYQRALQLSIPVVQPQWILACHNGRKMVPIAQFYLGATPNAPLSSAPFTRPQSMSQVSLQRAPSRDATSPPASTSSATANRASMPPLRRPAVQTDPSTSSFVNQSPTKAQPNGAVASVPEVDEAEQDEEHESAINGAVHASDERVEGEEGDVESGEGESLSARKGPLSPRSPLTAAERRARNGTMDRNFRFPPPASESEHPVPSLPSEGRNKDAPLSPLSAAPMEVPPPDPVEKERERVDPGEADDDIGATEEISLN
ncbi:hypothetical protein EW145_g4723 [Phellinidium pouzarii]|uniref:Fibronectin type-III domain-containing protein n=1 Tax=Phellinidium pouzarii TaxID=167371 RepID=A0A4V3XCE9_9AGAM|nr:hypothetical protein EW145_g4723 [Phellinidium pouzarii]